MSDVLMFANKDFGTVRTIVIDGDPWFVGKDVAEALGYYDTNKAVAMHVENVDKKLNDKSSSSFGQRGATLINESGLYDLVFGSKMDSAKKFKRWVTSEVIPAIRKTGSYSMVQEKADSYMIEDPIKRAKRWIEEREETLLVMLENENLTEQNVELTEKNEELVEHNEELVEENDKLKDENEEMRPKAQFHDDIEASKNTLYLGEFSAILQNNYHIKLGEKKLFEWCRQHDILCSSLAYWNKPKQTMLDKGYFQVRLSVHRTNLDTYSSYVPLITGKGQIWLTDKILKEYR